MTYKIMCIYDAKAEAYLRPFVMRSTGEAIRGFADEVNKKGDEPLNTHPEDYTLFELGEWDERSGLIKLNETKISRGNGIDFKRSLETGPVRAVQ